MADPLRGAGPRAVPDPRGLRKDTQTPTGGASRASRGRRAPRERKRETQRPTAANRWPGGGSDRPQRGAAGTTTHERRDQGGTGIPRDQPPGRLRRSNRRTAPSQPPPTRNGASLNKDLWAENHQIMTPLPRIPAPQPGPRGRRFLRTSESPPHLARTPQRVTHT